jgi:(R,R)-butanediol dehydrogenase/meso-butanediol dehydrogenase/diacetyl reductase
MKALRYYDRGHIQLDDVPEPEVGPGELKVEIEWCGICGSDIHEYLGGPISVPVGAPHPYTGVQAPVTLGHEVSAVITEVGEGVDGFDTGERVTVEALLRDDECAQCQAGNHNMCSNLHVYGYSWPGGGGFARYSVIPAYATHKIPASVAPECAALVEPLAVGLHALKQAGFQAGQDALVLGGGPIGLMVTVGLKAAGARTIVVSEPSARRREAAVRAGADRAVDPVSEDLDAALAEVTGGKADVVFEVAGVPASWKSAMSSVRPHGTVCNVAAWEAPVSFNPNHLLFTEARLTGSLGYLGEFADAIALLSDGGLDPSWMVTRTVDLDHAVEDGFDAIVKDRDEFIKVLVRP